jgi:hypothetical protein
LPSGKSVYVAYRRHNEIWRAFRHSVNQAMLDDKACWAIDDDTLYQRRKEGCEVICVLDKDNDALYIAHLEWFYDRSKAHRHNFDDRGGALQRYLLIKHFKKLQGQAVI